MTTMIPRVTLALLLLAGPGLALAQPNPIYGADRYVRLQYEQSTGRRGPVVSGYVYNLYGGVLGDIQLLVEGLDASGTVTSSTTARVLGHVPPLGRAFFEVPVQAGASSYRVTVLSFQVVSRGGA